MEAPRQTAAEPGSEGPLVRSGFVPLYYQLQEILKETIESGIWEPGAALPSEPDLARRYRVSRVVVRQALAILEDDHQIVRIRGRGTYVAHPKIDMAAGGLLRLLATARDPDVSLLVLDKAVISAERSIRTYLNICDEGTAIRITSLLSVRRTPLVILYSFFHPDRLPWLEQETRVGKCIPPTLTLDAYGVRLAGSRVSVETSHCGRFEADRFGLPSRSGVFLVHATEYSSDSTGDLPVEFARAEYRGDVVQLRLCSDAVSSRFTTARSPGVNAPEVPVED